MCLFFAFSAIIIVIGGIFDITLCFLSHLQYFQFNSKSLRIIGLCRTIGILTFNYIDVWFNASILRREHGGMVAHFMD